jgi:hypothetical protein
MKSILIPALIVAVLFTFPLCASADAVTWELEGITLTTGAVTGSFDYNADTNTYSDISLFTGDGKTYTVDLVSNASALFSDSGAVNLTGTRLLTMEFVSPLTDAGGTIDITIAEEETCDNATCSIETSGPFTASGEIVAETSAVPEPAPVALSCLSVLAIVGFVRRRRQHS